MRKIKSVIIVITLLISSVLLSAQPAQPTQYDIDKMASMMRDALELSYSQTIHLEEILTDISAQFELAKPDHLTNPAIVREEADNFRLAADEKIKSVLNDEQKIRYDQIKGELFKIALKYRRPNQI